MGRLVLAAALASLGVGMELPVDGGRRSADVGSLGLRPEGALAFAELAPVGPAFGVVVELGHGPDVRDMVKVAVPGPGDWVPDLVAGGGVQGAVPVQDAKWSAVGEPGHVTDV